MSPADLREADDATLVGRSLDGDERAWQALVERHAALVWAVARRAGLTPDDAADAFQSTWTIAVTDLGRIRDPRRFAAWIGRVARHQCLRLRRGYGIARTAYQRVAREEATLDLPDDEMSRIEERQLVSQALRRIGERCLELLRALYFQRPTPSYAEISERLGMRIGSIGPTRARCLDRLQSTLGEGFHG